MGVVAVLWASGMQASSVVVEFTGKESISLNVHYNSDENTVSLVDWQGVEQFRYIKIQPKTIDLSMRIWEMYPANSVVIPQSLVP